MPQPFERRGQAHSVGPPALVAREKLALEIAVVASWWSDLESFIGMIYAAMLYGEEPSAFANFYRMKTIDLRRELFYSVAEEKLTPDLKAEAEALFAAMREVAGSRNAVVHGTWLSLEGREDSLFLADPKEMSIKLNEICQRHARGEQITQASIAPDKLIEYRQRDFEEIQGRIQVLVTQAAELFGKVLNRAKAARE